MNRTKLVSVTAALVSMLLLSACANTIRGVGQDTANAVDATQSAGHKVQRAAR